MPSEEGKRTLIEGVEDLRKIMGDDEEGRKIADSLELLVRTNAACAEAYDKAGEDPEAILALVIPMPDALMAKARGRAEEAIKVVEENTGHGLGVDPKSDQAALVMTWLEAFIFGYFFFEQKQRLFIRNRLAGPIKARVKKKEEAGVGQHSPDGEDDV